MKYILASSFVFVFAFLTECTHAQGTVAIGVKGGISIPNLTAGGGNNNPINTGYRSRLGPEAALLAEFGISNHFSIQPMIELSSQGGKKYGLQAFPTPAEAAILFAGETPPPYLYANFKNDVKLTYLMLPVLAKYTVNFGESPFHFYVDAGPFVALMMSAKDVTRGSGNLYLDAAGQQQLPVGTYPFNADQNVKDQLHKGNAGIEGNVGFSYGAGRSNIFIEGGGNYGFVNIQKEAGNGENKTGAVIATIGYSYRFGNSSNQ